jgi:hypothetical protein
MDAPITSAPNVRPRAVNGTTISERSPSSSSPCPASPPSAASVGDQDQLATQRARDERRVGPGARRHGRHMQRGELVGEHLGHLHGGPVRLHLVNGAVVGDGGHHHVAEVGERGAPVFLQELERRVQDLRRVGEQPHLQPRRVRQVARPALPLQRGDQLLGGALVLRHVLGHQHEAGAHPVAIHHGRQGDADAAALAAGEAVVDLHAGHDLAGEAARAQAPFPVPVQRQLAAQHLAAVPPQQPLRGRIPRADAAFRVAREHRHRARGHDGRQLLSHGKTGNAFHLPRAAPDRGIRSTWWRASRPAVLGWVAGM